MKLVDASLHPCARSRARGFTLLEILVVMVIIALLSTGAILSMSAFGQDRDLENESDRLVTLLNYAREQADLQTREIGLYCGEHGYRFLAFDARTNLWGDIPDDDALRKRELPPGLTLRLAVEGRPVVLPKPGDDKSAEPKPSDSKSDSKSDSTSDSKSGDSKTGDSKSSNSTLSKPDDLKPHVMIFSNGDLTSFELTLERDGTERTATLVPDDQGRIKIRPATPEHTT
jgi:general secretion pathway protein H